MTFEVSVLFFPAFHLKVDLQFGEFNLVIRVTEYISTNSFVEGSLDSYKRVLRGEVNITDAAVFQHAVRNRIASFVSRWIACTYNENVEQVHFGLKVEVPLVTMLHYITHELKHVNRPEVVRTREVAFITKDH